jgi:hypothetical protein
VDNKKGRKERKQSLSFFAQGDRLIKRSPSLPAAITYNSEEDKESGVQERGGV